MNVRYGARTIELAKGKSTVEIVNMAICFDLLGRKTQLKFAL
jgi:hypothetical protein